MNDLLSMLAGKESVGQGFFKVAARALCLGLQYRWTGIGRLSEDRRSIELLAFCNDNRDDKLFTYDLEDTPCAEVYRSVSADPHSFIPDRITERFPEDRILKEMGAVAYRGEAFCDSLGNPVGHVFAISDKAERDYPSAHAFFRLVSQRVGSEFNRWQAENAVKQSEARLRQIIDLVPHLIYAKDRQGRFLLVNKAIAETLGTTVKDLRGTLEAEWLKDRAQVDRFLKDDRAVIDSGQPKFISEEELVHASGERRIYETIKVPYATPTKAMPAVLAVSVDITERKRAEERAAEHEAELARVLRLKTMWLLSSALAHQLNQPLAAVGGYCDGTLRRLRSGEWSREELIGVLEHAVEEVQRASTIAHNIASLIQNGEIKREPININDEIKHAVGHLKRELRDSGIDLKLDLVKGCSPVAASQIEVEQALLNLIRNGIEAMVGNPARARKLNVRSSVSDGERIEIAVSDTGPGIRTRPRERVFEPFFTTKSGGMGIGLSISRAIAEAHGGRLWIKETSDRGTTFCLSLTFADTNAADDL